MMKHLRALSSDNSGTSLVEAAIVLPLAASLLVGAVDFGRAYFTLATAEKSVGAAVRYLSQLPITSVCNGTSLGWGVDKAKNVALYGDVQGASSGQKLTVAGWQSSDITVTITPACPISAGAVVSIAANVPFSPVAWQMFGFPNQITMKASYEGKWIGQ